MPIPPETRLELVDSMQRANELLDWLDNPRPVLAIDTETTGLNPHMGDRLRMVQFGDATHGWAVPWERWSGFIIEVLKRWHGRPVVFHNSPFDTSFIENECDYEFDWSVVEDTRAMAHVIDSTKSSALKNLGARLIDPRSAVGEQLLKAAMATGNWDWATIPYAVPEYWSYSAVDPVLTYHLREHFLPIVTSAGATRAVELEVACARVVAAMQKRGMRVDLPYCEQQYFKLVEYGKELQTWARERYDCKSLSANAACIAALEMQGILLEARTKSGKSFKIDEAVLSTIDHPLARGILRYRKSQKIATSYFQNLLEFEREGIVHPSINQMGARTGRMSIARPALQTIPKTDRRVRDAFIPREGHTLFSLDCQAIEMRLLAHFAGERSMIEAVNAGKDLHTFTAQLAYGVDVPTKAQRVIAKTTGFARIYGAGTMQLARTAGISYDEAKEFQERYDDLFPGVRTFISDVYRLGITRKETEGSAYVKTPFGRHQRADKGREYALVNYLIQGTASEVMKRQLVALGQDPSLEVGMLLTVHDEVLLEFPTDETNGVEMAEHARRSMEVRDSFAVPIAVTKSAPLTRWGDVIDTPSDLAQAIDDAFFNTEVLT